MTKSKSGRVITHLLTVTLPVLATKSTFLPPANEVWGKVIFLHLSVILFTGGHVWWWLGGVVGGHAWQGGMHGGGHVWQGGHAWWGCA